MLQPLWQWFLEPGDGHILIAVIIAFVMGLIVGRSLLRIREQEDGSTSGKGDKAFLKGIQYLLSNDHDQAIEEFTKSVQINSDTIETYVALGNLYRSKGDIDRAIRIRQNIILRPNIDAQTKLRTLYDLGLDYRKGGFLNRALNIFLEVVKKSPSNKESLEEIEKIYEEMQDWENAYKTRQKIARLEKGDHQHILAHHLVEMGKVFHREGDLNMASSMFHKAVSTRKKCVDAYLHLGDLCFSRQEYKKAVSTWKKIVNVAPQLTFLAYRRLEGAYSEMKNLRPVREFLKECAELSSDAFTYLALARYLYNENDIEGALSQISSALKRSPYFWEARRFRGEILLAQGKEKTALNDYKELIQYLNMPCLKFQCSQCGFEPSELQWLCPKCKKWDTVCLVDSTLPLPTVTAVSEGPSLPLPGDLEK